MSEETQEVEPLEARFARIQGKKLSVYTDGGLILNSPSTVGGTWAFVIMDGEKKVTEQSGFFPVGTWGLEKISCNVAELVAVLMALRVLPDGTTFDIYIDSFSALSRLVNGEHSKWVCVPDKLRALTLRHRARMGSFEATLLAGHPNKEQLAQGFKTKPSKSTPGGKNYPVSVHNVRCDELCTMEAKREIDRQMEETAKQIEMNEELLILDREGIKTGEDLAEAKATMDAIDAPYTPEPEE